MAGDAAQLARHAYKAARQAGAASSGRHAGCSKMRNRRETILSTTPPHSHYGMCAADMAARSASLALDCASGASWLANWQTSSNTELSNSLAESYSKAIMLVARFSEIMRDCAQVEQEIARSKPEKSKTGRRQKRVLVRMGRYLPEIEDDLTVEQLARC